MISGSTASASTRPRLARRRVLDVVSTGEDRAHVGRMVRAAVGFRVDGRDGRVGVLTAVGERIDAPAGTLEVTTGLFSVTVIDVPFADVIRVDRRRRRVHINADLAPVRVGPEETARRLARFLRAAGR